MYELGYACCCISFEVCVSYCRGAFYPEFFVKEVIVNSDFVFAFLDPFFVVLFFAFWKLFVKL